MDVYKRPMFLQGGGPPAPVNAPVNASPNVGAGAGIPQELQMAMVNAEQEGAAIGQGIGQKFVTSMFDGLDNAEDYEQAINALRGNELPLSARYDELGEIVGEEDAKDTPESVLALVQPAIMMTEEGAMNSGVGGLMEGLTGDVPVEGPMEEGIGSLMMAGQPDEPPMPPGPDPTALGPTLNGTPQGFAVGGAVTRFRNSPVVQNFNKGGTPNWHTPMGVPHYYEQDLSALKDIIDTDEQTKLAKSNILFDIARRGLAFAGGVNPDTGQRMTGSPMSQFATAASGLPKTVGEQMAAVRAQEQKLKLAAYQSAQAKQAAAIERSMKTFKLGEGDVLYGRGPDGSLVERGRGAEKWRKPDLYYHELSNGEFTPPFNINDKNGAEESLAEYRDKTGNTKAKIVNTFSVGTRPTPKTVTPQMAKARITLKDGTSITTPPFNMVPKDAMSKAVESFLKKAGKVTSDVVNVETFKIGTESESGDKVTTSKLRAFGLDPDLALRYSGSSIGPNSRGLVDDYFAASPDGRKSIQRQLSQYEASLHALISPYHDKDSGQTVAATGLSKAGEQAVRNRMALVDDLDPEAPNYDRDKKLLDVSSRLREHIERLDGVALADVEFNQISGELKNIRLGSPLPGEGAIEEGSRTLPINEFVTQIDFKALPGGVPGWFHKALNKVGALAQQDWKDESKEAADALKDMYSRTTRLLTQLNEVTNTRETKKTYEAIEELNPAPQGITVTKRHLMRRAGQIKAVLEDSLADAISRGATAKNQRNHKGVLKSLDQAKTLRRFLFQWAYVENSLRGGVAYSVDSKESRKIVRSLFGKQ